MKAYMSDPELRYNRKGQTFNKPLCQMVALREARAILAETEPWAEYPERCTSKPDALDRAILAEALEAFIGEPCHCAGGIHWNAERGYYHCNGILPERI